MPEDPQSDPGPLDPQRFHERWEDGAFELVADRQPWSAYSAIVVGGGFAMFVLLIGATVDMWDRYRVLSIALMLLWPVYVVLWGPVFLGMRFSRVCITLSRHEVRFTYRPRRVGEKDLTISRTEVTAFATERVQVAGAGVGGKTTVDRFVVRTKDGHQECDWRSFATDPPPSFNNSPPD